MERDTTSQKKEAENHEFEAWLDFRNFRIRLVEAVAWINEIESAKSIVDLKTPYSTTADSKEKFSFKKKLYRKKTLSREGKSRG